jgi:peptidyl-prolyl cis-trans isomerase D
MAKGGKVGQALVWVLLLLLIIGLAGFGVTNFGGTVRSIGKVGDQPIATGDYARALQQELRALSSQAGRNVTFSEAQTFGIDASVRQALVATAALDNAAAEIGISAGDARLAREVRSLPVFQGPAGGFDREAYRFQLEQSGFTEAAFEDRVRADLARGALQTAIGGGFTAPEALGRILYTYVAERRDASLLRLTADDLATPPPAPGDGELRAFYDANPDRFTRPEARRITWVALLPEAMAAEVPVDEDRLRALYDARIDEFVQPERRLVERLVFPDDAAATDARNRLDAGTADFETLVAERGLTPADIDLGDVGAGDLGAAGDAVFAAEPPGVVGPFATDLGPALFRVNGVLAAEEVPYDEAREQLVGEFVTDAARRMIADRIEALDDLLAGGATLEDLAREPGMQMGTLDLLPGQSEGMAAYAAFRDRAAAAGEGDFPEIFQLDDGGVAALRLDAILPPELRPFDEVAEDAAEALAAERLAAALAARADEALAAVAAGGSLGAWGIVTVVTDIARDEPIAGAPGELTTRLFAMAPGAVERVEAGGFVGLLRLDGITPADPDSAEARALRAQFTARTAEEIATDAFTLFARASEARAGIQLDEAAINAVHAQMR